MTNRAEPRTLDTAHLLHGLLPLWYQEAGLEMCLQHILCFLKCPSPAARAMPELPGWLPWLPKEMGHLLQPCTAHPHAEHLLCMLRGQQWLSGAGCIAGVQPQLLQGQPAHAVLQGAPHAVSQLSEREWPVQALQPCVQGDSAPPEYQPRCFSSPSHGLSGPCSKDSHCCPLLGAAMPSVIPCKSSVLSHPSPSLHGSFSLLTCHSAKPC